MNPIQITDYESARDYLLGIPKFTGKHTMEDTRAFWQFCNQPCAAQSIIHVAGTNGKGSVCTYLRSILEHAGRHTAVFVSPHLVSMRERFLFDGKMVSPERFLQAFQTVYTQTQAYQEQTRSPYHPSFFEFLFFMFIHMEETAQADVVILETGLGGRLDATNILPVKKACVITEIGFDHMEYLGDTIEQIAGEKAGILRENTPVIYAADREVCAKVIAKKAAELHAPAYPVGKCDFKFVQTCDKSIAFSYNSVYYKFIELCVTSPALYQLENASLALRTIEVMFDKSEISREQLQAGIADAFWEGRMEEVLPQVYVDGAHNEDGIRAFLQSVSALPGGYRNHLIFAAVHDKRYEQMLELLAQAQIFDHITITKVEGSRATGVDELLTLLAKYTNVEYDGYEHAEEALDTALAQRGRDERILIAGSLYLVGQIKAHIGRNSDD